MVPNVSIKNATLAYHHTPIFSQLNFDLPAGKWVALLGTSGIGKSTLLRMIAGLPTSAQTTQGVFYADNGLPLHPQIAYMAQTDSLLPWLTVLQNATLTLKLHHHDRAQSHAITQEAIVLLEKVGLSSALDLYPHQLSGGMRQRVALVRTLMEKKPIVLMDEPFSALDTLTRFRLHELATTLLKNKTVLFVTHDPAEALRLADHLYIMKGSPATLAYCTAHSPEVLFQALAHASGEA